MVEYRLEDLARISGVSARNIRAYRERGLLDPPRRVGRSAYYGERHLAQLTAISQLLAKGFNSAHIAEFFASLRRGQDLADTLGIQRSDWQGPDLTLKVDPTSEDVRTLVEFGLVQVVDGAVVLTDPVLASSISEVDDQPLCVRVMARTARSTGEVIDRLSELAAATLAEYRDGRSATGLCEVGRAVVVAEVDRAIRARLSTVD